MIRICSMGWKGRLGLLCLTVLLAAGACASDGDLVATVNGVNIYMAELEDTASDEGEVVERVAFEDRVLSMVITQVLLTKALEEFGIDTEEDPFQAAVEEEYQALRVQATSVNPDYEAFLASQGITDERVRLVATQRVVVNGVRDGLIKDTPQMTPEEVDAVFESSRVRLTENVCATHVLLENREQAEAVLERVEAGESISDLARELSIEPSASETGGLLGCLPASTYVEEFAEAVVKAELMVPYGPVESQFGHHVILVADRTDPLLADHEEGIRAENATRLEGGVIEEWFLRVAAESDVQVEPQYGTWTTQPTPRIIPAS